MSQQRRQRDRRKRPLEDRVLYGIAIVVACIAAYGAGKAYLTSNDLTSNVRNQVQNRTANVATWCGAINAGRDYDRAFIRSVTHGHLAYTLGDLNCSKLESKTLASTKR